jgi:hypothetical protein
MSNVSSLSCWNIRWDITPNEQCFIYIMSEMKYCSFGVISHRMFRHDIDETLLIWRYISSNVPAWYIDETLLIWRYISSDVPAWYRWNIAHLALYLIECSRMISMKHCSFGVISHRMFRYDIDEVLLMRYNAIWAILHLYHSGTFDEI